MNRTQSETLARSLLSAATLLASQGNFFKAADSVDRCLTLLLHNPQLTSSSSSSTTSTSASAAASSLPSIRKKAATKRAPPAPTGFDVFTIQKRLLFLLSKAAMADPDHAIPLYERAISVLNIRLDASPTTNRFVTDAPFLVYRIISNASVLMKNSPPLDPLYTYQEVAALVSCLNDVAASLADRDFAAMLKVTAHVNLSRVNLMVGRNEDALAHSVDAVALASRILSSKTARTVPLNIEEDCESLSKEEDLFRTYGLALLEKSMVQRSIAANSLKGMKRVNGLQAARETAVQAASHGQKQGTSAARELIERIDREIAHYLREISEAEEQEQNFSSAHVDDGSGLHMFSNNGESDGYVTIEETETTLAPRVQQSRPSKSRDSVRSRQQKRTVNMIFPTKHQRRKQAQMDENDSSLRLASDMRLRPRDVSPADADAAVRSNPHALLYQTAQTERKRERRTQSTARHDAGPRSAFVLLSSSSTNSSSRRSHSAAKQRIASALAYAKTTGVPANRDRSPLQEPSSPTPRTPIRAWDVMIRTPSPASSAASTSPRPMSSSSQRSSRSPLETVLSSSRRRQAGHSKASTTNLLAQPGRPSSSKSSSKNKNLFLKRKLEEHEQATAANIIQTKYRDHLVKKREHKKAVQLVQNTVMSEIMNRVGKQIVRIEQSKAAVIIQKNVRMHLQRMRFQRSLGFVLKLQFMVKRWIKRHRRRCAAVMVIQRAWRAGAHVRLRRRAALTIQRLYRGHVGRRDARLRRREADEQQAAILIQSVIRGHWARTEADMRRQERNYVQMVHNRNASAVSIQRLWRGHIGRSVVHDMRAARNRELSAVVIQRVFRGHIGRRIAKQESAARTIQKCVRGHRVRNQLRIENQYRQQTHAVVMIQKTYRGYQGRKTVAIERDRLASESAAVKIQKLFRGFLARKLLVDLRCRAEQHAAAVTIQKHSRSFLARKYLAAEKAAHACLSLLVESAICIQRYSRGYLARKRIADAKDAKLRYDSAVMIQKHVRGFIQRDRYRVLKEMSRRNAAAVVIQKVARSWLDLRRIAFESSSAAAMKIQQAWRRFQSRRLKKVLWAVKLLQQRLAERRARRKSAAVTIQRYYRGHSGRRFVRKLTSVMFLQRVMRGFFVRMAFYRRTEEYLRHQASLIQAVLSSNWARNTLARKQVHARMIQKVWRSYRRFTAARTIQSCWRSHVSRAAVARMHAAARLIQSLWRYMYSVRPKVNSHAASIVTSVARRFVVMFRLRKMQRSARRIQKYWRKCSSDAVARKQHAAATKIAMFYRWRSLIDRCKRNHAATMIAMFYRWRSLIDRCKRNHAATTIAMFYRWRSLIDRCKRNHAATTIAMFYRWRSLMDRCRRNHAATTIALFYRRYRLLSRCIEGKAATTIALWYRRRSLLKRCDRRRAATMFVMAYRRYCVFRRAMERRKRSMLHEYRLLKSSCEQRFAKVLVSASAAVRGATSSVRFMSTCVRMRSLVAHRREVQQQSWYWGYTLFILRSRLHPAQTQIARVYRGLISRRIMIDRNQASRVLQKCVFHIITLKAAITIQRHARGLIARRAVRQKMVYACQLIQYHWLRKRRASAAKTIQRTTRGFLCRLKLTRLRLFFNTVLDGRLDTAFARVNDLSMCWRQRCAAVKIQAWVRRLCAQSQVQTMHAAATLIKKLVRGREGRKFAAKIRYAQSSAFLEQRDLVLASRQKSAVFHKAALIIQHNWLSYLVRKAKVSARQIDRRQRALTPRTYARVQKEQAIKRVLRARAAIAIQRWFIRRLLLRCLNAIESMDFRAVYVFYVFAIRKNLIRYPQKQMRIVYERLSFSDLQAFGLHERASLAQKVRMQIAADKRRQEFKAFMRFAPRYAVQRFLFKSQGTNTEFTPVPYHEHDVYCTGSYSPESPVMEASPGSAAEFMGEDDDYQMESSSEPHSPTSPNNREVPRLNVSLFSRTALSLLDDVTAEGEGSNSSGEMSETESDDIHQDDGQLLQLEQPEASSSTVGGGGSLWKQAVNQTMAELRAKKFAQWTLDEWRQRVEQSRAQLRQAVADAAVQDTVMGRYMLSRQSSRGAGLGYEELSTAHENTPTANLLHTSIVKDDIHIDPQFDALTAEFETASRQLETLVTTSHKPQSDALYLTHSVAPAIRPALNRGASFRRRAYTPATSFIYSDSQRTSPAPPSTSRPSSGRLSSAGSRRPGSGRPISARARPGSSTRPGSAYSRPGSAYSTASVENEVGEVDEWDDDWVVQSVTK